MNAVATEVAGILFDLDGTLVDTAPDMAGALNDLRSHHDLDALPYGQLRALVSHGSRALVGAGFGELDAGREADLVQAFLDCYAGRVSRESTLFDGMEALLTVLDGAGVAWGVVTNKPRYLSERLMQDLALHLRSKALVCGDTLSQRKPHPMPLLHAAGVMQVKANRCIYVGDAERDIQAGRAAGMVTVAAAYGYVLPDDCVSRWGADFVVADVGELVELLQRFLPGRVEAPEPHGRH